MDLDLDKLATAAATTAVKELIGGTVTAGKSIWAWIKSKAGDGDAEDVTKIEAAPEKPSTPDKLKALLKDILHGTPDLQEELARLLKESGNTEVQQIADVKGDKNIVGQQAGHGNAITVKK